MFEVSNDAVKELNLFFEGKEKSPIRVYLAPGGCSGPHLAMALDEPSGDDDVIENNGFTFCIQKELYKEVESIKIDLTYMGFTVIPGVPFAFTGGCGGCSGCSTTGEGGACGTH